MKKILFMLPVLAALFFVGCSSEDDEQQDITVNISLSKEDISINVNEEAYIDVHGIDINECTVSAEDEFVVYASKYDGKINIEAEHIGETHIIVRYGDSEKRCKVTVTPNIDYIGSTVTDWGITSSELREKIERPYETYTDDPQRGSKNYTYIKSGYRITNRYYFENGGLCGVEKVINASGSDTDIFLNVSNSLFEYAEYETNFSETLNTYPTAHIKGYIYSYPRKYYAVYKQERYDILWEIGTSPKTKNIIYFAKDLETAKEHEFTFLN